MASNYKNQKVLVVDNSSFIAMLIKNRLAEGGFQSDNIAIATDGQQAIQMMEVEEYDLVTSGWYLRPKDGKELLNKIRNHPNKKISKVHFVVITSERSDALIEELQVAGADGYLAKPFDQKDLTQTLKLLESTGNGFFQMGRKNETLPLKTNKNIDAGLVDSAVISVFAESTVEAFGQFMVAAEPDQQVNPIQIKGDFSASIEITDPEVGIGIVLFLYLPKTIAFQIYENIFGGVVVDQVSNVVEELGNILGGMVKLRITEEMADPVFEMLFPDEDLPSDGVKLDFNLGLPQARAAAAHQIELASSNEPRFSYGFNVEGAEIFLQVYFRKTQVHTPS